MSFWSQIHKIAESLDQTNYYQLLGVQNDVDGAQILERYYHLAAKLHPDKFAQASKVDLGALSRIHARFQEARKVLANPHTRKAYNSQLETGLFRFSGEFKTKPTPKGPTHHMAVKCYEEGLSLKRQGKIDAARKQLTMAKRYESHPAIEHALENIESKSGSPKEPAGHSSPPSALSSMLGDSNDNGEKKIVSDGNETPQKAKECPPPIPPKRKATSAEDRDSARTATMLPVRINIKNKEQFKVLYTQDISKGGMFLVSEHPKPKGTVINLTVVAPNGKSLLLTGTVVHVRQEGKGKASGMGVKFDDTAKAKNSVEKILKNLEEKPTEALSLDDLVKTMLDLRDMPAHQILNISREATLSEAEDAYADLIQKYHPLSQKEGDPMIAEASQEILSIIIKAYDSLNK